MDIQDAHFALVRPLQILRHTPIETLCEVYKLINGTEIEKAHMKIHASLLDEMYVMLVNEFTERHGTGPEWPEKHWDYFSEAPENLKDNHHKPESRPAAHSR